MAGRPMGRRAKLVIAEPIESWFEDSLGEVRKRVSIADTFVAGVRASGSSVIARLLYPRPS